MFRVTASYGKHYLESERLNMNQKDHRLRNSSDSTNAICSSLFVGFTEPRCEEDDVPKKMWLR